MIKKLTEKIKVLKELGDIKNTTELQKDINQVMSLKRLNMNY